LRVVEQDLRYLAIGALSFLVVSTLEMLSVGLEGQLLRTEIYSLHGFSHIFFGIGLASLILFLRPRSAARIVILAVLVAGIAWELHEGSLLRGEPMDTGGHSASNSFRLSVSMPHKKEGQGTPPMTLITHDQRLWALAVLHL